MWFFSLAHAAGAPVSDDLSNKEGIEAYIAAQSLKMGIDASIPTRIVELESNFEVGAVGDSGAALGLAQFHEETFYRMKRLARINSPALWGDERTEIQLLVWALKNGYGHEWSTYGK